MQRTKERASNLGVLLRSGLLGSFWYRSYTTGGVGATARGHLRVRYSIVILVYESGLLRRLRLCWGFLRSLLRGSLGAILLCLE